MPFSDPSKFSFDIKSGHLSTVNLIFRNVDINVIADDLSARFSDVPEFFDDDAVSIDLSALDTSTADAVDWSSLLPLLRKYRMHPVAVKGLSDAGKIIAKEVGLIIQADVPQPVTGQSKPAAQSGEGNGIVAGIEKSIPSSALVIDKPLRSGQRVYAKGRDLVMLAMVNAGAEVIADGHIHVYAPLRGRAIAGARGNTESRIFALQFSPELVSIAGVYKSIDGDLPNGIEGQMAQASLLVSGNDERLIYQALGR